MKKTKKNSVWGTRMKSEVSSVLQAANSSIEIDKRLYQEDIQGSIAHCTMLAKRKIIDVKKSKNIIAGLKKIELITFIFSLSKILIIAFIIAASPNFAALMILGI